VKVLFIYPSSGRLEVASKKFLSTGAHLPPLGILYLGKMLELHGHSVEVIDCNAEGIRKEKIKNAVHSADAVGLTLYSEPRELKNSVMISKFVNDIDPDIPVIVGGPHATLYPESSLVNHNADVSVKGAGELAINLIIEALDGRRDFSTIPNIYYRQGKNINHTKLKDEIGDLDEIPFPARHLVKKYEYGHLLGRKVAKGKLTSIITSRGCPFKCRFCNLHSHLPYYKVRSVENIKAEIKQIVNEGYSTMVFVDDNFLAQPKKVEKIMDFIIEQKYDIHIWIQGARVDSANRRLYEKMKDANVELISYGIESGNQDILDFYNKKITLPEIKYAVKLSNKMGFFVHSTFILGAPIETEKHLQTTINFAKSLPLDFAIFYQFGYSYKSPIWEDAVKVGKIKPEEGSILADSRRGLGNFTLEELKMYTMMAHKKFFMNPILWMRTFYKAIIRQDFRFVDLGLRMIFEK